MKLRTEFAADDPGYIIENATRAPHTSLNRLLKEAPGYGYPGVDKDNLRKDVIDILEDEIKTLSATSDASSLREAADLAEIRDHWKEAWPQEK